MHQTHQRKKILSLLGITNDTKQFKNFNLLSKKKWKDGHLEDWKFINSNSEIVPGYFLYPEGKGPFPIVIYCHAHGGTYDVGRVELLKGRKSLLSDYGTFLLEKGFAILCLEMACFGSRKLPNESNRSKSCLWNGRTLFGQMISELMSGVDFIFNNPLIEKKKIISFGLSMGATHSFWLAALDKRIHSSIHMCAFADLNCLLKNNLHDMHGHYMTVPNLLKNFNTAKIAGLIAPRQQLVCVGLKDKFTNLECFSVAQKELKSIYSFYSSLQNLEFYVGKTSGH